jgi:hypothetical protein
VNGAALTQKKRSRRYLIRAPLQYRISGERTWHRGISANISESGILFEGENALKPNTRLEVHLTLPVKSKEQTETSISVQAIVVRGTQDGAWAARFLTRRLRHSPCRARIDSPDWGMGPSCPGLGFDYRTTA